MIDDRDAGTVVVVAADAGVRQALCATLELAAYRPVGLATAREGLERARESRLRAAVMVVRLPVAEGVAFLRSVREIDPWVGAVLVADQASGPTGDLEALCGGLSCVREPYGDPDLLGAVGVEIRRRIQRAADGRWREVVEEVIQERTRALEAKVEQFATASLEVLVTSLEARDAYMSGHSVRVAQLSASLADALGHPEDDVEAVRLAGRLHDIGMLVINDRVVNREGPLTPAELDQVRQHPLVGHQLLQPYPHLGDVARFIRGHHERWDGTGYPDGLAGEAIPWGARIIAAVETYDALVTRRAYRAETLSAEAAFAEVQALAGKALDPAVCAALSRVVGRRRTLEFVVDAAWREPTPARPLMPA